MSDDTGDAYVRGYNAGREAEREKVTEQIVTMLLSDDAVEAFGAAWTNADTQDNKVPGARRRAGLEAVAALVVARGEA